MSQISQISPEVRQAIGEFVQTKQSFISLDVYCKIGRHFDDSDENPIHEQVRAAYSTDLMPNYLCRWVCLRLEGGGFANCWKYYLPVSQAQVYDLAPRVDGRVELSRKVLGTFALLEQELGLRVEQNRIILHLSTPEDQHIMNAASRIVLSVAQMKESGLDQFERLQALVYANRIEIVGV